MTKPRRESIDMRCAGRATRPRCLLSDPWSANKISPSHSTAAPRARRLVAVLICPWPPRDLPKWLLTGAKTDAENDSTEESRFVESYLGQWRFKRAQNAEVRGRRTVCHYY